MKRSHYLFFPGPVMVSETVRKALLHPEITRLPVVTGMAFHIGESHSPPNTNHLIKEVEDEKEF